MLLLEGKANLRGTGAITMPSADTMAQAPAAIIERFQAVREVDLRKDTVGVEVAGEWASRKHPQTSTRVDTTQWFGSH